MMQEPTTANPIEEIHRIRREISDRFEGDIGAIAADAARRARESGRPKPRSMMYPLPVETHSNARSQDTVFTSPRSWVGDQLR